MKTAAAKAAEKERRRKLQEVLGESGSETLRQFQPGMFGCHELLDRLSLVGDVVEEFVLDHPACVQNPDWYALADKAVASLRELYQRVGSQHLTENGDIYPTTLNKAHRKKRTG